VQEAERLVRETEARAEETRQREVAAADEIRLAAEAAVAAEQREIDQKAARDARYAARKARKRG
ncbi:hypothetical protein HPY25_11265, partial [Methylobacterium sp. IIF4SW-B5]|nr:hypothetical protein [Methylobacterium ajmalii]